MSGPDDPRRRRVYSPVAMPSNKRERQRENRAKKLEVQKKLERQRKLRKRAIRFTALAAVLAGQPPGSASWPER